MRIYQPAKKDFENYPAGPHQMVCVDVIDCGWKMREYGGVPKGMTPAVRLVFQGEEVGSDGYRLTVRTFEEFMLWSENSRWYKTMKAWLGIKAVDKIIADGEFEPESQLLSRNALVTVEHKPSKKDPSDVYANIESIAAWHVKFGEPIEALQYERVCARQNWEAPRYSAFEDHSASFGDAPVPDVAPAAQATNAAAPSAMQRLIIHCDSKHGKIVTGNQVSRMLKAMEYHKAAPIPADLEECAGLLDSFIEAGNDIPGAIDQPKPGQASNATHNGAAHATKLAAVPVDEDPDHDPFADG